MLLKHGGFAVSCHDGLSQHLHSCFVLLLPGQESRLVLQSRLWLKWSVTLARQNLLCCRSKAQFVIPVFHRPQNFGDAIQDALIICRVNMRIGFVRRNLCEMNISAIHAPPPRRAFLIKYLCAEERPEIISKDQPLCILSLSLNFKGNVCLNVDSGGECQADQR